MPGVDEEGLLQTHFIKARFYTPLPTLHLIGMLLALQMTIFLSTVMVMGPASVLPPAADTVAQIIIRHGAVESSLMPPSLIEDLCADPSSLELIRKQVKYIDFAGAPLRQRVGNLLAPYLRLMPGIGSTEARPYWPRARNDDLNPAEDWKWYSFRPSMGIFFEQRTKGGLYELVFRRQEGCERWQQIFHMYPNLDEYSTKDLWAKHPTREGLWEFAGRMDDLIILSHGEDLFASKIERVIEGDSRVKTALVGGEGRKRPFLILELIEGIVNSAEPENPALTANIWPAIEKANEFCSEYVRLSRELTIFASPSKPLMSTAKGTVARRDSLALYAKEIMYGAVLCIRMHDMRMFLLDYD
ncbi:hypothetical protein MMC31_006196 [Peltigera leucophlebia]|nr:hypothetical protein [Peltigera leucophlebia]